jgi:hypothetical protein
VDTGSAYPRPELQQLLGELNQLLWRERDVLDDVLYRLEVQQLLLVEQRDRWVDRSVDDLERALGRVERYQRMHRDLLDELSAYLPVHADSTLSEVAAIAPSPWDDILEEQQAALLVLITEIEATSRDNFGLARHGLTQVGEAMERFGRAAGSANQSVDSYGPTGLRGPRRSADAMLLDRQV